MAHKHNVYDTDPHVRLLAISPEDLGTNAISVQIKADGSGASQLSDLFTAETLGENYYRWTLTDAGKESLYGHYYWMSLYGTGENLVITHDEPIG